MKPLWNGSKVTEVNCRNSDPNKDDANKTWHNIMSFLSTTEADVS